MKISLTCPAATGNSPNSGLSAFGECRLLYGPVGAGNSRPGPLLMDYSGALA